MLVAGLTGNYGMGKSRILSIFAKLGAYTFNSDTIVAALLTEKDVLEKIRGVIGHDVFNKRGSLNKKKVAGLIFRDKTLRRSLEDILHPLVFKRIKDMLKTVDKGSVVVVEVPLLFERGHRKKFDKTITVFTDEETALKRLEKAGVKRTDALLRLQAQLPIREKMKRSDFIIDNSGSIRKNHFPDGSDIQNPFTTVRDMEIIKDIAALNRKYPFPVLTIGNYDGVHLGHQKILSAVLSRAKELKGTSMVMTFDPHPMKVLAPEKDIKLLITPDEKTRLLEAMGIDVLLLIPFTREFAGMLPDTFIDEVLVKAINAREIIVGSNYTFGKQKQGTVELLRRRGKKYGFSVQAVREVRVLGNIVSSSSIRSLLLKGSVNEVATFLGRAYMIDGTVIKGKGRGQSLLRIPTANITTPVEISPKAGVYAVKARFNGAVYEGVANIGKNPTFGNADVSYEVHLFDFSGDLLGQHLRIYFIDRLRGERTFPDAASLEKQIRDDMVNAREILKINHPAL